MMKQEASLEQWNSLYQAAAAVTKLAPWEDFWNTDLIVIQESRKQEPLFMSVSGRGIHNRGVTMYIGNEGLEDFDLTESTRGEALASFALREQRGLSFKLCDREDVPQEQRDMIKELGLAFRGRGKWPCFLSWRKAYAPWTLDGEEVQMLTEAFCRMEEAVKDARDGAVKVRFERGEFLWRSRDEETGDWRTVSAPIPSGRRKYPLARLRSVDQIEAVKSRPRSINELSMDLFYMNAEVVEEGYDRPFFPRAFLVMEKRTRAVLNMQVLEPEDNEVSAILHFLLNYIMKSGRPRTVYARNPWIFAALTDTCENCGIPLLSSDLEEMEEMVNQLTDAGMEE